MPLSYNRSAGLKRLLGALILQLGVVWLALTLMGVMTGPGAGCRDSSGIRKAMAHDESQCVSTRAYAIRPYAMMCGVIVYVLHRAFNAL